MIDPAWILWGAFAWLALGVIFVASFHLTKRHIQLHHDQTMHDTARRLDDGQPCARVAALTSCTKPGATTQNGRGCERRTGSSRYS